MFHPLNILIRLMPLACNQHNILRLRLGDGLLNRGFAVGLHQRRIGNGGQDVGDDGLRRFGARVVAGYHHAVGKLAGDGAHQRAFAAVAVAAAAEHAPKPAFRLPDFAQGGEGFFQRVGRVGVIHHHQRFVGLDNAIHAPCGGTDAG